MRFTVLAAAILALASSALAHGGFSTPRPRSASGYFAPCGRSNSRPSRVRSNLSIGNSTVRYTNGHGTITGEFQLAVTPNPVDADFIHVLGPADMGEETFVGNYNLTNVTGATIGTRATVRIVYVTDHGPEKLYECGDVTLIA
ncbi:hypothetical protein HDU67_001737 [Dinochytrium kinnereticum]|nr:hypothetical protein HDU67_001737 [Dinochytrium kinnereticum]